MFFSHKVFLSSVWACSVTLGSLVATYSHAADPAPVVVSRVELQPVFQEIQLTGTVTSAKAANLSPATAGLVSTLLVEEGDYVAAGDALLELDKELVQLQWQSSNAQVQEASVALADAQRRLQEAKTLAAQKNIAATTVKDREAEVATNKAALVHAQATADYQRALLQRHTLRAPFTGVIAERSAELGEWVAPGQGVLSLVATDTLRLDFSVAETYLAKIERNAEVAFTIAGQPDLVYQGHVQTVVPVTDPNARTFLLRVALTESADKKPVNASSHKLAASGLLPGMSVQAKLSVATGTDGIVVPRDALLRYPDGRTVVWQLVEGDAGLSVAEKQVQVGLSHQGYLEIKSGLSAGAEVVVRGNEGLHHGQLVKRVPTKSLVVK